MANKAGLEFYQGNLIAGGRFGFEAPSNLARWNGESWEEFAGGSDGAIFAIQAKTQDLYVGGSFGQVGETDVLFAAKITDGQWFPLNSASSTFSLAGPVVDIEIVENDIYAAAEFALDGQLLRDYVARWDGSDWHPLGGGVDGEVLSLSEHEGQLVAAGAFVSAGSSLTEGVAIWNGVIWNSLPCGTPSSGNAAPRDLLSVNSDIFIGVTLSAPGAESSLFRWRSGQCELIDDFNAKSRFANIHALLANAESVFIFGALDPANMLTYDGVEVDLPSPGDGKGLFRLFSDSILAMQETSDGLYVGGKFTKAGQVSANNIVRWTDRDWARLESMTGEGVNSTVVSLEMFQESLFLGGFFSEAGGISVNGIARWDGSQFHSLEPLPNETWSVTAMETFAGRLIIAPLYVEPPAMDRSSLVSWDGSTWSQFANFWDGTSRGRINEILAVDNSLYVTGHFDTVMNIPARNIAVYQNNQWQALGEGLQAGDEFGASGLALHYTEGVLYVGGIFDQAGLHETHNFAGWSGDNWIPEVKGTSFASSSSISAITSDRNCIYVGGTFRQLGDLTIDNLGCLLRDHTWTPVLNGVDGPVKALFPTEIDSLWVGGDFETVPPYPARNIAFLDGPELIFRSNFE